MDQNQKLRIALVIIFSLRIRHFNLEPRISQQMLNYKQISIFIQEGVSVFINKTLTSKLRPLGEGP